MRPQIYANSTSNRATWRLRLASSGVAVVVVFLVLTAAAAAQTLHVTSSADSGPRTLRAVIAGAGSGDTVVIDPGVNPVLTQGQPITIDSSTVTGLTIEGQGARATSIDGGRKTEIFRIGPQSESPSATDFNFSGLTLQNGFYEGAGGGGAVGLNASASFTDVAFVSNRVGAVGRDNGLGGAIASFGPTLLLDHVTATGNDAINGDGPVGSGGAVYVGTGSSARIIDSTFNGNEADDGGGGISNAGSVTLIDDTFAANSASDGGNLLNDASTNGMTLQNTIVSGSPDNCAGPGPFVSTGGNLEDTSGADCGIGPGGGDLVGVNPQLGPLGNNGGQTDTMALAPGSLAVNHISAAGCQAATDQRGLPRPGVGKSACDIGAYEVQAAAVGVTCAPAPVAVDQPTTCTATVTEPAGFPVAPPPGSVVFSSGGSGAFSPASCTLAGTTSSSSCSVTYVPSAIGTGSQVLTASYGGTSTYPGSSGTTSLAVTARPTAMRLSCAPAAMAAGQSTTCAATVTDLLGAAAGPPKGVVTFASGGGRFGAGASCLLSGSGGSATCSVPFTVSVPGTTITASYGGDALHSGVTTGIVVPKTSGAAKTTVGVSCSPGTVLIGAATTCAATVRSSGSTAPTGSVRFTLSGGKGVTGGGTCRLSGGPPACSVRFTVGAAASGTYTVTGVYGGDDSHDAASMMTSFAPAPTAGQAATLRVLTGRVLIRLPHSKRFSPAITDGKRTANVLSPIKGSTLSLPMGSVIDTRHGTAGVSTASDYRPRTNRKHALQTGKFSAGIFALKQQTAGQARRRLHSRHKRLTGIPALSLILQSPRGAVTKAGCQRPHPPAKGVVRELDSNARGLYRVIAAASNTTIHTGIWNVRDLCGGTFTEVGTGHATVTPTKRAKPHQHTVVVGPGQGVLIKGVFR